MFGFGELVTKVREAHTNGSGATTGRMVAERPEYVKRVQAEAREHIKRIEKREGRCTDG
jgi:hypothetical protein